RSLRPRISGLRISGLRISGLRISGPVDKPPQEKPRPVSLHRGDCEGVGKGPRVGAQAPSRTQFVSPRAGVGPRGWANAGPPRGAPSGGGGPFSNLSPNFALGFVGAGMFEPKFWAWREVALVQMLRE